MADMTLSEAAAECKKFGQTVRAFEKVAEVATALQAIEQNVAERVALRDRLGGEIDSARATLALELDAVEKARSDGQALVDKAAADAREIKQKARDDSGKLVADAQAAVEQAGVDRATAQAECAAARAEFESLKDQLAEARHVIEKAEATRAALAAVGA